MKQGVSLIRSLMNEAILKLRDAFTSQEPPFSYEARGKEVAAKLAVP